MARRGAGQCAFSMRRSLIHHTRMSAFHPIEPIPKGGMNGSCGGIKTSSRR